MEITTIEIAGFKSAIEGMRNPLNSWDKSDSYECEYTHKTEIYCDKCHLYNDLNVKCSHYIIGKNDLDLAQRLIKGGTEHCKFLRQIQVWVDFNMPRYWWSEFDTYKIGTSANSCSTMHKLLNNTEPITRLLFVGCMEDFDVLDVVINRLEELRKEYQKTKNDYLLIRAKRLLPEGFLQLRTVNLNYQTIRNIYHQRKNHRLKEEWIDKFCSWVETLPYAQELIIN